VVLDAALGVPVPSDDPTPTPGAAPLFAALGPVDVLRADTSADRAGRQREALDRARAGESLTVKEHAVRHGIDPATASRDLRDLEGDGALRAEGQRRSLRFLLPD
jgi:DNA-binding transcriptional ArsR family regulator